MISLRTDTIWLAQAYALHINGVYDHYSWRAYLGSGGDPDQIYKPLDGWKPGGSRESELDFWMQEPVPARKGLAQSGGGSAGRRTTSKSKGGKEPKKAAEPKTVNKTVKKAAAAKKKATKTKTAKKSAKRTKPKTVKKNAKAKTSKR